MKGEERRIFKLSDQDKLAIREVGQGTGITQEDNFDLACGTFWMSCRSSTWKGTANRR